MPRRKVKDSLDYDRILVMLQQKRQEMDEAIVVIERLALGQPKRPEQLPSSTKAAVPHEVARPSKRNISPAGLKRMSEASKKRWSEHRKAAKTGTGASRPPVAPKAKPRKSAA